ncbi:NADH:flavin oxidoreductase, partial [Pseudomonas stutzeri]|nr:NADH:flavin oxidoreductase [Stutzerimonas stutzeri]
MSNSSVDVSVFQPLRIGPLTLPNRFIKAATNEGAARNGIPTGQSLRLHERIAAGGAGMTTLAYCA